MLETTGSEHVNVEKAWNENGIKQKVQNIKIKCLIFFLPFFILQKYRGPRVWKLRT